MSGLSTEMTLVVAIVPIAIMVMITVIPCVVLYCRRRSRMRSGYGKRYSNYSQQYGDNYGRSSRAGYPRMARSSNYIMPQTMVQQAPVLRPVPMVQPVSMVQPMPMMQQLPYIPRMSMARPRFYGNNPYYTQRYY